VYLGSTLVWEPEDEGWTPADIPNLYGWWDPSDVATITNVSGAASQWNDKSGNARHFVQTTAGARPALGKTINGLPALEFPLTPSYRYMQIAGLTLPQPYTIVAVAKYDDLDANARNIVTSPSGVYLRTSAGQWQMYSSGGFYGGTDNATPHVFVSTFDTTNSVFRIDKTQVAAGALGNLPLGSGQTIMVSRHTAATAWQGLIGEVLIFSGRLSGADQTLLEDYLTAKWITPSAWTPASIPGLGLWIDPAQDTFADGEKITTYREHSPFATTLTSAAGQEATFRAGAHPYLDFTSTTFGLGNVATLFNPGLVGLTMVAVGHRTVAGQTAPMMLVVGPNSDGYEIRFAGDQMEFTASYQTSFVDIVHPTITNTTKDYLHVARVDVPKGKTDTWVDNVLHTGPAPVVMRNVAEAIYLGRREQGYPYIGTIKEALAFAGPISDNDLALLRDYLTTKHGL
jgi:hypothetical protein